MQLFTKKIIFFSFLKSLKSSNVVSEIIIKVGITLMAFVFFLHINKENLVEV